MKLLKEIAMFDLHSNLFLFVAKENPLSTYINERKGEIIIRRIVVLSMVAISLAILSGCLSDNKSSKEK